jgi:hypothetical protein
VNEDSTRSPEEETVTFDLLSDKEDRRSHIADLVQTIKETADKLEA